VGRPKRKKRLRREWCGRAPVVRGGGGKEEGLADATEAELKYEQQEQQEQEQQEQEQQEQEQQEQAKLVETEEQD
jgi:hypothetical protein